MRLATKTDIKAFRYVISKCEGPVWLESPAGDRYELKSVLSQYAAIGELLKDRDQDLEIFASNQEDQARIAELLHILAEKNERIA